MLQLLFTAAVAEMAVIVLLSFKTPLRKVVIMALDRVKRGRGPVMVKTIGATVAVVLFSSLYSMVKIRRRGIVDGAMNPTDQVLMAKNLLEVTLMGSCLFLVLMIDRQHHYIRELRMRRKTMESVKKQSQAGFEDGKAIGSDEKRAKEEELATLQDKLKELESELERKSKDVHSAETNAVALRKQSEGFLLEYDRLLEENQNLRNQLQTSDRRLSHSSSKKNS